MNVTYVHADKLWEFNSAGWRCTIPADALNKTRKNSAQLIDIQSFSELHPVSEYACQYADVIILQRGAMPESWNAVRYWRERGKVILADIDDGYPQITAEHPAFAFWHLGEVPVQTPQGMQIQKLPRPAIYDMADGLKMVSGLTSPNRLILSDWRQTVGVKGEYIPNYLPVGIYNVQRTRTPHDDGNVWVAWGGSAGHLISFIDSGIIEAIARVLSARPHTRFVMAGADVRILDRVPLKTRQKIHLNWQKHEGWPTRLVNFDVGIIPLNGEFDARRSTLKPLEYSMMSVPWIASKSPAYDGLENYGTFVDNTPQAWADALIDAIDGAQDMKRIRRAKLWAEEHLIDRNTHKIIQAYERLMGKVQ